MPRFKISGLEVEIEGNRCRLIITKAGVRTYGDWRPLPLSEGDLSITTTPASQLGIAVRAIDLFGDGNEGLKDLLTKPK